MKLKRNATDKYFSDIIRERANWKCERCLKDFSDNHQGLHCSHFIGRGNKNVRWDLDNASALCGGMAPWGIYGCHKVLSEDPGQHYLFFEKKLGRARLEELIQRSREMMKGSGRTEESIRKELKAEYLRIKNKNNKKILGAR